MNKFIKISIIFIIFGLVLIVLAAYLYNGHLPRIILSQLMMLKI